MLSKWLRVVAKFLARANFILLPSQLQATKFLHHYRIPNPYYWNQGKPQFLIRKYLLSHLEGLFTIYYLFIFQTAKRIHMDCSTHGLSHLLLNSSSSRRYIDFEGLIMTIQQPIALGLTALLVYPVGHLRFPSGQISLVDLIDLPRISSQKSTKQEIHMYKDKTYYRLNTQRNIRVKNDTVRYLQ